MNKKLSDKDLKEIYYLSKQSNGRHRLIVNLYGLSKQELYEILNNNRIHKDCLK